MFDWSASLAGRPASKKNSPRLVHAGGRMVRLPSKAYEAFHELALWQLKKGAPAEPYAGPVIVELECSIKGRLRQDIDNAATSLLDILVDAGVIANDDQVVELHAYKHQGAADWRSEIHVVGTE